MDIPLDVDVHCTDGRCGRSTYIILNPATEQVTHLVVRERGAPREERSVPIGWIANSTPDLILLDRTKAEFAERAPFQQTDYVQTDIPHYATDPKLTLLWPYVVPAKRIVDDKVRRIPPGELAVRRGARVRATDGRVGRVDEFIVGPKSGNITHLVLRERNLLGQREVCIPLADIERIEENTVFLKLDKKSVRTLPAIPVRRQW